MKTKIAILILLLGTTVIMNAQDKLITKTGHIWFYSHAPLEDIIAHTHQAAAIIDLSKGGIAVSIPMMSFEFKKALMQEHFNENYVESSKYPKARFTGTVKNLPELNFKKNGIYKTSIAGDLTIHNVTRKIEADGTIEVKDGKYMVLSKFNVSPKDYDIKIENRFSRNIASTIEVNVELNF
jgi:Uncharacterized conserved protein